jgi:voltage-gated sodium channel
MMDDNATTEADGGSSNAPTWRLKLRTLITSRRAQQIITALIVLNAITLALETSETAMRMAGDILIMLDRVVLGIFVLELLAKIVAHGRRFVHDPWNLFDFAIVAIALVPATGALSVLRALRILRVLRLISTVGSLRRVVGALLAAIPGMGSVVLLLSVIYFVFAVMATKLFAVAFPEWFGTIGRSGYTLFQIMTLESWSMGIVRPVMEVFPLAWLFFVPFILITSFAVLNLFIGIIVDAMQSHAQDEAAKEAEERHDPTLRDVMEELKSVRGELAALKADSGKSA